MVHPCRQPERNLVFPFRIITKGCTRANQQFLVKIPVVKTYPAGNIQIAAAHRQTVSILDEPR